MADLSGLVGRCGEIARDLTRLASEGRKILVVTHIDADGIASGSIIFASLRRRGANVALRALPELDGRAVERLSSQRYELLIFTDLASGMVGEISALGSRYLIVDHHQIQPEFLGNEAVLNAWQFGIDGGKESCSSTVAYILARSIDDRNRDLSPLAVVGAVADRQDGGPGRSLTGLNRLPLEDALSSGLVSVSKDLLLTGRETRPVHESIANTSYPYIPGLTGSKDQSLSALLQAGIKLKEDGRWRTVSELSSDEKKKVVEIIAGAFQPGSGGEDAISSLIGEVYTLNFEDAFTPLRDAREFATLLNACGRMGEPALGAAICLGDRMDSLKLATKVLSDYRQAINRAIQGILTDATRLEQRGRAVLVRGDGVVDERLLGPVTSILTSSPSFKDKVVVARTKSGETELKVSSRVGDSFSGEVNLGAVMREAALAVQGVGGGHSMAAGAKIPLVKADDFARMVLEMIQA
jgi:single-stranded-DNA-specific exonuclease